MLNELLRVEQLSGGYHRVPVLNEVSFHVREGEMVAIIGPNGARKTTLLKTISASFSQHPGEFSSMDTISPANLPTPSAELESPTCQKAGDYFPI
jgi:ABC-type branched-chain amino acid transport systems, ATPase component